MTDTIFQSICEMLCDAKDLEPSALSADTRLNTLKLDSLDYVELMVLAKREFDITLNARMFIDHPDMSLMDMCGLLNAQRVSPDA